MQTIQQMLDQNGRPPLEVTLDWLAQVHGAITSRNQAEGSAPVSALPSGLGSTEPQKLERVALR